MSDSLEIEDESQWREFIFFDSMGRFTRTTWWNENYVLDKGKLINQTIESGKGNYQIEIIDSFNIKISKPKYVGFFYGNPWKENTDFNRSLNRMIVGDSIKKKLIGTWKYDKNEIELSDYLKLYDELPEFAERKLKRVAQRKLEKDLKIHFTKENGLIAENEKEGQLEFRYIVDDKKIDISRSDYVISIKYELTNQNELVITKEYQTMGISKIYFKKE